jgi:uncharacterized membrane protein
MAADSVTANAVAVVVYFLIWMSYELIFDGPWRRASSLNSQMVTVRRHWMTRILQRENLITDSSLVGHSIHTATFFASTTVLVLAGLLGILGSSDRIYTAATSLSVIITVDQRLFEWKLALLIVIFVYTFFKFTWALRQFNYFCAIIGSAPRGHAAKDEAGQYATAMATVLGQAVASVNGGFRGYYFGFAAVGWIAHPLVLVLSALFMVLVLARRQFASPAARAVRDYAAWLEATHAADER